MLATERATLVRPVVLEGHFTTVPADEPSMVGYIDGVIRAQRPDSDGAIRDTAAFSILDDEWPMVKQQQHSRLNR